MTAVAALTNYLITLFGSPAVQLARAERLARAGNHGAAIPLLARAARNGVAAAQRQLGHAYLFGLGVPACLPAAIHWLTQAARAGEIEAQTLLANLALLGLSNTPQGLFSVMPNPGPSDYREALRWAEPAAAAGSAEAQVLLAFVLDQGPAELRDTERAEGLYECAARAGYPHGQLGHALVVLRRAMPSANPSNWAEVLARVHPRLEAAADAKLPLAHHLLALLAMTALPADPALAVQHFRVSAELGYAPSQLRLGIALLQGLGTGPNSFEAESWLRRAALGGESEAASLLGDLYAHDGELPANRTEASVWYRRAAEMGHPALGRLQLRKAAPDISEATSWLRQAVAQDHFDARNDLAGLALAGLAPAADCRATFEWFQHMAAAGDLAARFNLGLCYAEAIGTPRDDSKALACFREAAAAVPQAAYWCGRMLASGRGASTDHVGARAFYLLAADSGLADAQAAAAEMLANGRGGERDLNLAHLLFTRAAKSGHPGAAYALRVLTAKESDASLTDAQ